MGYKFEIWSWRKSETGQYVYINKYSGNSFIKAIIIMTREKIRKVGCVKFEWR